MKEQKQVKLIGFKAENHRVIKAINLTPDLLEQRLIQLVGDIGNGKSTLLEMLQTALSGSDAIKKKDALEKGYLTEVQLVDGDIKLYAGARVTEYQRGKNEGESKFEIFLYCKDEDGKTYTPVIDGKKATAADYAKMLTTELTFNMPDLFSSNATTHRKLIEKLFSVEISKLGIEVLTEKIESAKSTRDAARNICDAHGAFMDSFKEEGYKKEDLALLEPIDIESIDSEIAAKNVEKGNLTASFDKDQEVAKANFNEQRTKNLASLKEQGNKVVDKVRTNTQNLENKYDNELQAYQNRSKAIKEAGDEYISFADLADSSAILSDKQKADIKGVAKMIYDKVLASDDFQPLKEPVAPLLIEYVDGKLQVPEIYDESYNELMKERSAIGASYTKENESEFVPVEMAEDKAKAIEKSQKKIDGELEALSLKKKKANSNNLLYHRYKMWEDWMESKAKYEALLDELRLLYAKIDTGVDGLKIVPNVSSTLTEIWLKYDGSFDGEFFGNTDGEMRYLFDYSASQRGVIGVILQASRLDEKPKALRLAILDDVPMTQKGIDVLLKICESRNLQLITSKTDDRYDKHSLDDSEIVIEGGEVFFNKR